jgi:predicted acetyltransferase
MVERPEALQLMPAVYDRLVSDRPGLLIRDRTMWDAVGADDDPHLPASEARHYFLIHGDPPDGYAIYRVRRSETHDGQRATALVVELTALGPVAEADLWRHLLALDLVGRVERRIGPIDDPVLWLAQDPQTLQVQWKTGIWARLLDVPTALQTRRYQAGGVLVLDVSDPFLPEVGGRFHLQVRDGIGKCVETDDEPDLRLGISELSSASSVKSASALCRELGGSWKSRQERRLERIACLDGILRHGVWTNFKLRRRRASPEDDVIVTARVHVPASAIKDLLRLADPPRDACC